VDTLEAALSHIKPGRHRVWAALLENSLARAHEGAGDLVSALRHQRKSSDIEREVLRRNAEARLARARAVHEVAQARFEAEEAESTALRRSEVRLRAIIENTPNVAIQGYDIEGRIRLWNRASETLFGWSIEEAIDRSASLILDEEEARRYVEVLREIDRTGRVVGPGEWRITRKDGTIGTSLSTVFPIVDDRGEKLFVCMDVDITERKRMEEALAESEERLSTAFHASPNAVAITTVEDGRLIEVNQAFEQIFGFSREEALGRTTTELNVWWTAADRDSVLEDLGAGVPVQNRELRFRRKSGEAGVAELSMERMEVGGKASLLSVTRDVTDRKETESALRAALAEVDLLKRQLESENIYLREEIRAEHGDHEMVGDSEAFAKLQEEIRAVAGTESTVLLIGETGTGKELVARALHDQGPRRDRPLVKVNCSAVTAGLFESELFGHEKGAFTGADRRRQGRFEVAHGGTIFLDEIGDLPLEVQSKLLRVLEEREFERVGSSEPIQVDVRVIAATNRDLEADIEEGAFRSDLFYRLNVYPIRVPPLRDRGPDIPLLASHLLDHACRRLGKSFSGFRPESLEWMRQYDWPGNIRELRNLVDRAAILSSDGLLELAPGQVDHQRRPVGVGESLALESVERDHILGVLENVGWVIEGASGAAEVLGLKPSTLRHRMKRLGIRRPG
jgi:PAS domain S-box-containing protein